MKTPIDTLENKLVNMKASLAKMVDDVDNVYSIRELQSAIREHHKAIQILKIKS